MTIPIRAAAMAGGLLIVGATAVRAEVIVLSPGPTSYTVGTVLGDGEVIRLPRNGRMQVVLPSGDTRALTGPMEAKVGDLTRGVRRNPDAWQKQLEMLTKGQQNERVLGGTRGATR